MPSEEDSKMRDGGFLDPTRRTSRVFRHPDHKFEWTIREFEQWCTAAAREWGYAVHTGGIGKPTEEDGWGRDSVLGYATQTAVFTRLDGAENERLRAENARRYLQAPRRRSPELLVTHHHVPHPAVTFPPQSSEMILGLIKEEINRGEDHKILLRYLWIQEGICCACSGRIDRLVDAINAAENVLRLHITDPGAREDWLVELIGSSKRRKENLWDDQQGDDTETYDNSDEEKRSQLEELEDLQWEDGNAAVDVNMEPEGTFTSGWGAGVEDNSDWGFRANGVSQSGWGTVDHSAGDGGLGRDRDSPWTS